MKVKKLQAEAPTNTSALRPGNKKTDFRGDSQHYIPWKPGSFRKQDLFRTLANWALFAMRLPFKRFQEI